MSTQVDAYDILDLLDSLLHLTDLSLAFQPMQLYLLSQFDQNCLPSMANLRSFELQITGFNRSEIDSWPDSEQMLKKCGGELGLLFACLNPLYWVFPQLRHLTLLIKSDVLSEELALFIDYNLRNGFPTLVDCLVSIMP